MQGGMQKFMKQAQQMQKRLNKLKEEFSEKEFEASTGGGAVKATVNGDQKLIDLSIDPEAVDPDDVEMLEEMIVGAVSQAADDADSQFQEQMEEITGGMNIPGLM
jgi:DNA-binding YbaB/EbfC family protein